VQLWGRAKPDRKGGKLDGKRLRLIEFIDSKQKQFGSNQSESCDTVRVISESCDTVRVTSESCDIVRQWIWLVYCAGIG